MRKQETFTILSTNAPLVEVGGDGPVWDLPGGVAVPDGAATTAPLDLRNAPFRRFRVDAPATDHTSVVVTDSPYGAFVGVRRCVASERTKLGVVNRWPRLRAFSMDRAPSVVAIWHLFADDVEPRTWRDVTDAHSHQVRALGGDVVVISFVSPDEVRHA